MLAGLQPEVAEVLGKVQKAASEETFPDQMDLLNNLMKPLQGMRAAIDRLFASIDEAKNPNTDKEREVEMMVAHIQVNIYNSSKNINNAYKTHSITWGKE